MVAMKYPSLAETAANELAKKALEAEERPPADDVDDAASWNGSGERLDLSFLDSDAAAWMNLVGEYESGKKKRKKDGPSSRDAVEGQVARHLHQRLSDAGLTTLALDDPGFWRFLSLRYFWDFVVWRESKTFKRHNDTEAKNPLLYQKYINGRQPAECVLTRMYLRGRVAAEAGDPLLTDAVKDGTDFWRSHILRVQTGSAPRLTRAFVETQRDDPMPTDSALRPFARRLNRMWTNVVLHTYDDGACAALVAELRED